MILRELQKLAEGNLTGYHFSSNELSVGDTIHSLQHLGKSTYAVVWPIYSEVAESLGINFPKEYGYAYPVLPDKRPGQNLYEVTAPSASVIRGNLDHSLYVSMSRLRDFSDRTLPLPERLKERERLLAIEARMYFTELENKKLIELISPQWKVIRKL